ncbi:MAG: PAS domain-containing protein [Halobacteriota archaeon]
MTNQELKTLLSISIIEDIMDGMLDVVGTSDMEGRITQINNAVEAWGYKKEDLIGKTVSEFIALRSLPKLGDERKRTLEMGAVRNLELIGLRKAGSEFPVLVNVTLLRDREGKPGGRIFAVRDITERKQAEGAIQEREKQYRAIFNAAMDSFLICDSRGNVVEVNPQACKMYGYSYEEFMKLSSKEVVHPDYYPLFEQFLRDVQTTGEFHAESVDVRKDGSPMNIEVRGRMFDYKSKPHLLAVVKDITERKKTEEKLKLFSHSVESSVDGIAMGNLEGRITYVNEAFVRMFGYSKEELIGKEIAFIYPEDLIPELEEALKATMKGGWVGELVGKRKNGELFPMAISASTVLDDKGEIIAHTASHQDITERKRVEKEIRKLSSAVEQSIDGIAVGDIELNLTYVNDAFARMHGYSSEEMIGMKVGDLHTEEQIDEYGRYINQIKTEGSWMGEIGHVRKDGTPFPTYMYFTLLKGDDGEPTGILAVARDITERKKTEEALLKKGVELQHQITERKRVEEVLEITERKCRDIAEFLPDLISILPKLWSHELT